MDSVTNAGISCIARGCEKLVYITIENCRQIDDTALIAIGSSCRNLLGITITDSLGPRFSDRGLTAIACGCPVLESISIICVNMTDAGVIVLAQKCFHLKSVTLDSSKMITNASLIAFATNSRKLQSVSFSRNKVGKVNLLSLRRKYLLAKTSEHNHPETSEHNRPTSVLSMLWHFISWK
jgi:F-box and leucine-rich repeat protein 2/20